MLSAYRSPRAGRHLFSQRSFCVTPVPVSKRIDQRRMTSPQAAGGCVGSRQPLAGEAVRRRGSPSAPGPPSCFAAMRETKRPHRRDQARPCGRSSAAPGAAVRLVDFLDAACRTGHMSRAKGNSLKLSPRADREGQDRPALLRAMIAVIKLESTRRSERPDRHVAQHVPDRLLEPGIRASNLSPPASRAERSSRRRERAVPSPGAMCPAGARCSIRLCRSGCTERDVMVEAPR
jgi:hypothetical protein